MRKSLPMLRLFHSKRVLLQLLLRRPTLFPKKAAIEEDFKLYREKAEREAKSMADALASNDRELKEKEPTMMQEQL